MGMHLGRAFGSIAALGLGMSAAQAAPHRCSSAAAEQALKLLRFHSDADDRAAVDGDGVKSLGTIKALRGTGRFEVLEVPGSIYKADYRMRMIYAVIGGDCVLMGQEILEASDPF